MRPQSNSLNRLFYRDHPHLYQINARIWLEKLSRKLGRIVSLKDVPNDEWDRLRDLGFDFVYLMGVWRRSLVGRRLFRTAAGKFAEFDSSLPNWKLTDVIGSPFAIQDYVPDTRIGTSEELNDVHHTLRARGLGLILDFVPNHTGFDHIWIKEHPEWYVQGTEEDFHADPESFYLLENNGTPPVFIARGRDPNSGPWIDVAQLNYFNLECRAGMIGILKNICEYCDGVRCDMAMLVTNEVFKRTWRNLVDQWPTPNSEFWQNAIAEVKDLVWIAEVYWGLEWKMQALGFQFTYDKVLYDRIHNGSSKEVRAHLTSDLGYQSKLVRFLENHDEMRSAAISSGEPIDSSATLLSTLPGMRFYQEGQLEGSKSRVPMALARAADEPIDDEIRALYDRVLRLSNDDVFHAGDWKLLDIHGVGDDTFLSLIAYQWLKGNCCRLIVCNLGDQTAHGRIRDVAVGSSDDCLYSDLLDGSLYIRNRAELLRDGLYVKLRPHRAHAFVVEV